MTFTKWNKRISPYQPPTDVNDQPLEKPDWPLTVLVVAGVVVLAAFLAAMFLPIPLWASMWATSAAAIAMLWAMTRINRPRPG